jgi:hypothetical protein
MQVIYSNWVPDLIQSDILFHLLNIRITLLFWHLDPYRLKAIFLPDTLPDKTQPYSSLHDNMKG